MVNITCVPADDPNGTFNYCPSFPAAILFAVLFGCITFLHVYQAFHFRKRFCWVLIMAGLWETAGYATRTYNITNQYSSGASTGQILLILLAPLWINAFLYMTLGRMMHFFLRNDRVFGFRARRITLVFVLFDITAFFVQAVGGTMSSGTGTSDNILRIGLDIYTAGVGLQLGFNTIFCALALRFQIQLKKQDLSERHLTAMETMHPYTNSLDPTPHVNFTAAEQEIDYSLRTYPVARRLIHTVWGALILLIVRNIYRLVEYGIGGVKGNTITKHEWWMYVFDAVPMLAAFVVLSVYHVGRVLQGPKSDFKAQNRARKAEKKAKKQEKKAVKAAKKQEKKAAKTAAKRGVFQKGEPGTGSDDQLV